MYIETIIEIIQVFCAYFALIILFPAFVLKPILRKKTVASRFMIYLIVGNLIFIYLVFALAYLHILYRSVLFICLAVIGIVIRFCLNKKEGLSVTADLLKEIKYLFAGEYGIRLYVNRKWNGFVFRIRQWGKDYFSHKIIEWLFFLVVTAYQIWYFSHHTIEYVSFAAYDEDVHLYWIQSMLGGNIFPSGMYPHGFHNVLGALALLFEINIVNIVRVMGVISTTFIMTMMYFGMRYICRSRYAAVFGFFLFPFLNMFLPDAFNRYQFAIPQEYGMMFLFPMAVFLFEYLRVKKKSDLILFAACFSLTLLTHFYVTIIAGLLCVSVGLVYLVRIIKEKLLLTLILTGLIATVAALLPIGAGFIMGYHLEQSMGWAVGMITNEEDTSAQAQKPEEQKPAMEEPKEVPDTYFEYFKKESKRILEKYVFIRVEYLFLIAAMLAMMLFHIFLRTVIQKRKEDNFCQLSFAVFGMMLIFMLFCRPLGLPTIMEEKRVGIFLAYCTPLFLAYPFEIWYQWIERVRFLRKSSEALILMAAAICVAYICNHGLLKPFQPFYYFQPSGTMKTVLRVMNTYKDHTWTIVSSVHENSSVMNQGFHYELNDFIVKQEAFHPKKEIQIPTKYVFVVIEKIPNQFFGFWLYDNDERMKPENRVYVNEEFAAKPIDMDLNNDINYTQYRIELMSKAYYWAQEYQTYFPDEMNVYYEDEEVIVYRIEQNEYSLNNFAIDYGFNGVVGQVENKEEVLQ